METQTDPALGDDADQPQYLVRMSEPGEIAAALPYLLGFQPTESVVLVSLGGESGGRLGLTLRADLPPPEHAAALAAMVARNIATSHPAGVVVLIVSEAPDVTGDDGLSSFDDFADLDYLADFDAADFDAAGLDLPARGDDDLDLPHRHVVHEVVLALAARNLPVHDSMLVRGGRWWSYECPHPCCEPGAGTPLPSGVSELAVASVATGQVVETDRGRLVARIAPITGRAADRMAELADRIGEEYEDDVRADRARAARRSWSAIRRAVDRCRPGAGSAAVRLSAREVARVVWGLTDLRVRDRATGLALGDRAAAAEVLWTECTRRAPTELQAAPASLLAISAWLRGDGAMANVALDRALTSRPGYGLAELLLHGLAHALPPAEVRRWIAGTVAQLERDGL
jgi:antitoxin (DNA-binding transcriptional repressor) of toxin-antitoxin stability system